MFDNIAGKVKGLAKFVCWFGIIASIIYAIVIWASGVRGAFLVGLLNLVIGVLASWIGSWSLYALGEAADCKEKIASLERQLARMGSESTNAPAAGSSSPSVSTYRPTSESMVDSWVCPKCGTRNKRSNVSCKNCGEYR